MLDVVGIAQGNLPFGNDLGHPGRGFGKIRTRSDQDETGIPPGKRSCRRFPADSVNGGRRKFLVDTATTIPHRTRARRRLGLGSYRAQVDLIPMPARDIPY